MQTIIVNIDWENNYGAYSEEVSGCVATHKTLEGVKKPILKPWNSIWKACEKMVI
jgi:predicted RNase H-like HicB family nuclease